jgi:hypothetical protein
MNCSTRHHNNYLSPNVFFSLQATPPAATWLVPARRFVLRPHRNSKTKPGLLEYSSIVDSRQGGLNNAGSGHHRSSWSSRRKAICATNRPQRDAFPFYYQHMHSEELDRKICWFQNFTRNTRVPKRLLWPSVVLYQAKVGALFNRQRNGPRIGDWNISFGRSLRTPRKISTLNSTGGNWGLEASKKLVTYRHRLASKVVHYKTDVDAVFPLLQERTHFRGRCHWNGVKCT